MATHTRAHHPSSMLFAAIRFFPPAVRDEMHALDAFIREARSFVDVPQGKSSHEQRTLVEDYRRKTIAAIRDPASVESAAIRGFVAIVRAHTIPELEVHALFDSIAADAYKKSYKDAHELQHYMRGSASPIAAITLAIIGHTGERDAVKHHIKSLIDAFQMAHFVSSIDHDYHAYGRVYIPQTVLHKHGVTEEDLKRRKATPGLRKTVHELVISIRNELHDGVSGIKHLTQESRLALLLASLYTVKSLERIEKNGYDPFVKHAGLSATQRFVLTKKARFAYIVLKRSELRVCGLTN